MRISEEFKTSPYYNIWLQGYAKGRKELTGEIIDFPTVMWTYVIYHGHPDDNYFREYNSLHYTYETAKNAMKADRFYGDPKLGWSMVYPVAMPGVNGLSLDIVEDDIKDTPYYGIFEAGYLAGYLSSAEPTTKIKWAIATYTGYWDDGYIYPRSRLFNSYDDAVRDMRDYRDYKSDSGVSWDMVYPILVDEIE